MELWVWRISLHLKVVYDSDDILLVESQEEGLQNMRTL